MFAIGVILMALGLAGCQNEDETGEAADSGNGTSTQKELGIISAGDNSVATPEPNVPAENSPSGIFQTPEFGVLVKAATATEVTAMDNALWYGDAVAAATFKHLDQRYDVNVYSLDEGEILVDWMKRSSAGDSFFPDLTAKTADGHTGYVYESNDLGLMPDVHFTVATDKFVYNFRWDDGLPKENPEEALRIYKENPKAYKRIPPEFMIFIQELELQ